MNKKVDYLAFMALVTRKSLKKRDIAKYAEVECEELDSFIKNKKQLDEKTIIKIAEFLGTEPETIFE